MRHLPLALLAALACGTPDAPPPAVEDVLPGPGHVPLRRLNRSEYDRTVRDLIGTAQAPALDFPADDAAHGFDNAAEALAVSPLWLELAEGAAAALAREIVRRPITSPTDLLLEMESGWIDEGVEWNGPGAGWWSFASTERLTRLTQIPRAGRYAFSLRAQADHAGDEGPRLVLLVDGVEEAVVEIHPADRGWVELRGDVDVREGSVMIGLAYVNDYYSEVDGDRNVRVDHLRLTGPVDFVPEVHPAWTRVMVCDPELAADATAARECARQILTTFLPRAWRRPIEDSEVQRLLARYDEVVDAGDSRLWGVEFALRAALTSPHFLFHVERPTGADGALDAWALANRLSYFLWSSMPDEALSAKAADGTLLQPDVLAAEAKRMLRDPRAHALVDDLAGQWLGIRALDTVDPDPWAFPAFSEPLRASMRAEMVTFFATFIGKERSLRELLTSEWGYADYTLAAHYGLDVHFSDEAQPVGVTAIGRGGWLGQAGLQTALAYPTRTSPVKRGVWVLTELLCDEPEPAPPNVPGFPDANEEATTIRERLEAHRVNPACATCHDKIDPIGLAFEHFDGIGAWREMESNEPIDAAGVLPDGTAFYGVRELSDLLADDARYTACLTKKVFLYAHHRDARPDDAPHLKKIEAGFQAGGLTMDALVASIVRSDTFRRAELPVAEEAE